MPLRQMECGPKCRSKGHASELSAAITKGNLDQIKSYTALCYNGGQLIDKYGRSALHVASSCGKLDVVEWLLEEKQGDVTLKDFESGWTALHRAIFYGQLTTARLLIQFRSDVYTRDHEGLGPLDVAMKDRSLIPSHKVATPVYELTDPHDVYTWGDNSNFTLGHGTEQKRQLPEVLDEFRKQNKNISQSVMSKYHSVFLTTDHKVYTCGHGHGGRLGHPTEETCLVPKQVQSLNGESIIQVAAARDHTLFLSKSGVVFSCGTNQYHQLGQVPAPDKCLVPRAVNCKTVKGHTIQGTCAGRFHTVLYTTRAVFTCGLNAGQLGHPKLKGDDRIGQLRQVSQLNIKGLCVVDVKCSDAATVVVTESGEIFVLHEYQCRKIASNRQDILRMYVVGGNLNHSDSQVLRENGGQQLIISLLDTSGKVFIWREKSPSIKRVRWLIRRLLYVKDFILTETGLAIVTDTGEVFTCTLTNKPSVRETPITQNKESVEAQFGSMSLMDLLLKEETEEVHVHRVPNIHRAMYITADKKGHNYTVLQVQPNFSLTDVPTVSTSTMCTEMRTLYEEADEYDLIHDLMLQVNDHLWPVHRYILLSRCANFTSLLSHCVLGESERPDIPVLPICDIPPQMMEQLLMYIYTDTCDLLTPGATFQLSDISDLHPNDNCIFEMDFDDDDDDDDDDNKISIDGQRKMSAFEAHQKEKAKKSSDNRRRGKGNNKNSAKKGGQSGQQTGGKDPVKMLQDIARRWAVKGLTKRLDSVKYVKGHIESTGKKQPSSALQFYREKYRDSKFDLCDISIMSTDGVEFLCHKCVLVARLEYFHHMLMSGWMETSSSDSLSLPVAADILEILLEYIYTDSSNVIKDCKNVEFLCNILVVADQMLVIRLKEMCEVAIATLITMKNVGELLEFSTMYNAQQLTATCHQYIVLNLPALLENRCLDVLSDEVMDDLSKYYKNTVVTMSRRIITPYDEGPDKRYLESLCADVTTTDNQSQVGVADGKKAKPKKKRNRTKSFAEEQEKGSESQQQESQKGPDKGSDMTKERKMQRNRRTSGRLLSESSDLGIICDEDASVPPDTSHAGSDGLKIIASPTAGPWCQPTSPDKGGNSVTPASPLADVGGGIWASAASSPPQKSLRDIMAMEKRQTDFRASHNSNNSGQTGSNKFSWKGVKKQQQQQKKHQEKVIQSTITQGQAENQPSNKLPGAGNQDMTGSCPWGSVNKGVQQSFQSLMDEQLLRKSPRTSGSPAGKLKKPSEPSTTVSHVSTPPVYRHAQDVEKKPGTRQSVTVKGNTTNGNQTVSWGLPIVKPSPKGKTDVNRTINTTVTSPVSPRENPWGTQSTVQSPRDAACSFTEILESEIERCDILDRTSNKPLALIQMEEKAIHDLLQLYRADDNVDEHITVERVTKLAATPLWKRERLQSS